MSAFSCFSQNPSSPDLKIDDIANTLDVYGMGRMINRSFTPISPVFKVGETDNHQVPTGRIVAYRGIVGGAVVRVVDDQQVLSAPI